MTSAVEAGRWTLDDDAEDVEDVEDVDARFEDRENRLWPSSIRRARKIVNVVVAGGADREGE